LQAIILAAGLSKRLRPLTDSAPKCLLKIGEKTILGLTINNIFENDINDFIIVTGYRENMIKDFIAEHYPKINVTFLTNSDYKNNNNSYSLWMTREYIRGDVLLLDSDILFDSKIISKLLKSGCENCLAVNRKHILSEEEIKVLIDSANKIRHIGKEFDPKKSFGESIGIEKFSEGFFARLGEVLNRKIVKEKNVNEFYETSFQELIDAGNDIYAVDVSEFESMEIDTPEDLKKAEDMASRLSF
jgi:choline kinase